MSETMELYFEELPLDGITRYAQRTDSMAFARSTLGSIACMSTYACAPSLSSGAREFGARHGCQKREKSRIMADLAASLWIELFAEELPSDDRELDHGPSAHRVVTARPTSTFSSYTSVYTFTCPLSTAGTFSTASSFG